MAGSDWYDWQNNASGQMPQQGPRQGGPGDHSASGWGAETMHGDQNFDHGYAQGSYGGGYGGPGPSGDYGGYGGYGGGGYGGYGGDYGGSRGLSGGAIAGIVVGAIVLLALIGGGAYFVMSGGLGGGSGTSAGPITSTVVVEPEPEAAQPTTRAATPTTTQRERVTPSSIHSVCDSGGNSPFSAAAAGTSVTSCPFAVAVKDAYLAEVGQDVGESATVTAYSPVTGSSYTMNCTGGAYVTCRGGNNAVVHIY